MRDVDFVADVQPILRKHCFECHAEGNEEGGLNLGVRARVMEGSENGVVLKPGDGAASRLIHLVAAIEQDAVMPPEGDRLTAEQVGILRAWIDQGAKAPANERVEAARPGAGHWAFRAPVRPRSRPSETGNESATRSTSSSWSGWRRRTSR